MAQRKTQRVALVGCGAMGAAMAHVYPLLAERARVVAVVDTREDRALPVAERLGATAYGSLSQALLHEEVDAVDVRVPHALHEQVALEAITAGKNVLVEKPLATTLDAGRRIVDAAETAGVVLCVAENYSFYEPIRVARRLIEEGAIGPFMTVRTNRVTQMDGVWVRDGWRVDGSAAGAGVLIDQGCHQANLLRRLAGEVTHVHAYGATRKPTWSAMDTAVVNCRLANGAVAQQLYCWGTATPGVGAEAYVYGVDGSIEIHVRYGQRGGGALLFRPDLPPEGEVVCAEGDYVATHGPTIDDWLRTCTGDHAPAMPGIEGLRDLAIVQAAVDSMKTGEEVAVEPLG